MKGSLNLSLRAGERLFVNGAVLRVDRRVVVQFLNDVTFLLEAHVMQAEEATTPLKQLYFMLQSMLLEPEKRLQHAAIIRPYLAAQLSTFENRAILDGLMDVRAALDRERAYDAMKALRGLFVLEAGILDDRLSIPFSMRA
jgi:flagellar biosynthesis repressor protein FlbT